MKIQWPNIERRRDNPRKNRGFEPNGFGELPSILHVEKCPEIVYDAIFVSKIGILSQYT